MGVFFVPGNWEYWHPIRDLHQLLSDSNIINLSNKKVNIKDNIWLIGFDDEVEGTPDLSLIESLPSNSIALSFFHSPSFFKMISHKVKLSFAGHSHGGQIRFPFIGALWTPEGIDKYIWGWFKENDNEMYVSRGIGTSVLPIRFNCRPEITFFTLHY